MALPRSPINIPGSQINDLRLALNDVLATVVNGSAYSAATGFFPLGRPSGPGVPAGTIDPNWIDTAALAPSMSALVGIAAFKSAVGLTTTAVMNAAFTSDSAPVNTDGVEYARITYTPKYADTTLRVRFWSPVAGATGGQAISIAIFRDSTVTAVGASGSHVSGSASADSQVEVEAYVPSNSTNPTTFMVRFGTSNASNVVGMNTSDSTNAHIFGTAGLAYLTVEELVMPFVGYIQRFNGVGGSATTGSLTIPAGATGLVIRAWGGGGSGGACHDSSSRANGGGGGAAVKTAYTISTTDWTKTIAYTIGQGALGQGGNGAGNNGGTTNITSATGITFSTGLLAFSAGGGGGGQARCDNSGGNPATTGVGGTAVGGPNAVATSNGNNGSNGSNGGGGNSGTLDGIFGAGQFSFTTGGSPGGGSAGHNESIGFTTAQGGPGRIEFIWS